MQIDTIIASMVNESLRMKILKLLKDGDRMDDINIRFRQTHDYVLYSHLEDAIQSMIRDVLIDQDGEGRFHLMPMGMRLLKRFA